MRHLLIHVTEPDSGATWGEEHDAGFSAWVEAAITARVSLQGSRLRPAADATAITSWDGGLIITDGPYAETKEQIVGYDLIECASLDEAVAWAARHPDSWLGAIEVRALPERARIAPLPAPEPGKVRYLLLVCAGPSASDEEPGPDETAGQWAAELDARGVRKYGSALEPADRARTVRVRGDRVLITDGPFAETKEQIAGFDVVDCADLDEAIEVAGGHPLARAGTLEVRPFWPFGEE